MEGGDSISHGVKHSFNLVVATFVNGEAYLFFCEYFEFSWGGSEILVGEVDTLGEMGMRFLSDEFGGFYEVGLGHVLLGLCESA